MIEFVKLYYGNGYVLAASYEEPRIDAAVTRYFDSCQTRDELLTIDLIDGVVLKLRVSQVESWYLSTPETRRVAIEQETALETERKAHRAAVGEFD